MKIQVMVDVETLGKNAGCVIASVGAVKWCEERGFSAFPEARYRELYRTISLKSCTDAGLVFDPETVAWWLQQDSRNQKALFEPEPAPLGEVLTDLRWFIWQGVQSEDTVEVWAHGATFDIPILDAAYKATGLPRAWHYRAARDTRTLYAIARMLGAVAPAVDEKKGRVQKHHALIDAYRQARRVQETMKWIATAMENNGNTATIGGLEAADGPDRKDGVDLRGIPQDQQVQS